MVKSSPSTAAEGGIRSYQYGRQTRAAKKQEIRVEEQDWEGEEMNSFVITVLVQLLLASTFVYTVCCSLLLEFTACEEPEVIFLAHYLISKILFCDG